MNDLEEKKTVSLDTPIEELEQMLLKEKDIDQLNNVINIFNLVIKRKDIVRTNRLNDLQDKIAEQMNERISRNAGEFSNKDLLDYFKVLQDAINRADNSLDKIDTPSIQINQQVNINADNELSRESKERVKNFVASLLANSEFEVEDLKDIEDLEVVDEQLQQES